MPSKREQILQNFESVLSSTAGISGRVYRSDPNPTTRELSPFITLEWQSDAAAPVTVPQLERRLSVQVSVYVRGDLPDTLADPIMISAHSLVMADTQRNGLAIDTMLADASFEMITADQTAGKLMHTYDVNYRHSYGDMTS